jgi:hypothetical protein
MTDKTAEIIDQVVATTGNDGQAITEDLPCGGGCEL